MARPGELAELIADAFGLETATVREQARVLRNAGFMAKEKGGRGSGSMTFRDATNLLLAVAGTGVVCDSTIPVEQHGATKSENGRWTLQFAPIPEMRALLKDHTLADAIEAIIRSVVRGSFQRAADVEAEDAMSNYYGKLWVQVTLFEPIPWANLEIGMRVRDADGEFVNGPSELITYRPIFGTKESSTSIDPPLIPRRHTDLSHEHKFTHQTIVRVGDLLRE